MENKSKAGKVISIIVDIFVWILLVIAILLTVMVFSSQSNNGVPNLLGTMPITIQTNSMEKTLNVGDLITAKKIKEDSNLQKGDIITYWTTIENKKVLNTHRIVEVISNTQGETYITKGDNNPINDKETVNKVDLVGKYTGTKIPGLGYVVNFLQSSSGFLFCIVLPLLLFFLYQIYRFVIALIAIKKPKLSAELEDEIKKKAVEEYISSQNKDK